MSETAESGSSKEVADHETEQVFLAVVDDSDEMPIALHFACRRAEHTDGRALLCARSGFQHWMAVGALMWEEAREAGEELCSDGEFSGKLERFRSFLSAKAIGAKSS